MTLHKGAKLALLNNGKIIEDDNVCHKEFEVLDYGTCAYDYTEILIRVKVTK